MAKARSAAKAAPSDGKDRITARKPKTPKKKAVSGARAGLPDHQVAALPLRRSQGEWEVCLITTRETRRWLIPKGWPMKGRKDHEAAAIEAREEAGLVGHIGETPIGSFLYGKRQEDRVNLVRMDVYRLDVEDQLPVWRESGERELRWLSLDRARLFLQDEGLAAIVAGLAHDAPAGHDGADAGQDGARAKALAGGDVLVPG